MQVAYEILKHLQDGRFHSGARLAQMLGVARTNIWKGIHFLKTLNIEIYAVRGRGYRLAHAIEMLDKTKILASLDRSVHIHLQQLDILNLTTSTNDYLIKRLHPHLNFIACAAEGQSLGRGRLGRKWESPFGVNLYFSIFKSFNIPLMQLPCVSLVTALAVVSAIHTLTDGASLLIKWPNDIIYDGKKVGGILAEQVSKLGTVIGIGLNVSPYEKNLSGIMQPISSLERIFSKTISRNALTAALLNHLIPYYVKFEKYGFNYFQSEWQQFDALKGHTISLSTANGIYKGRCLGVNDRGEICIIKQGIQYAFHCGEASIIKKN